ncbi:hypothetical protein WR25_14981 isoform A [Diploscapter pachys]|nr:hypothetical protein WR25_14981 isoform A [Diploscapter pachys]
MSNSTCDSNSCSKNQISERTIGIDLGTTRCCVAAIDKNGIPFTIENDQGLKTTPSYVLYESNSNVKVGKAAMNSQYPGEKLIYDSKRLIGRQYSDQAVTEDCERWSFVVVRNDTEPDEGKAMIKVNDRLIAPEKVSAELLKSMKRDAERHFGGQEVKNAVITVPAYFNSRQKEMTMEAAKIAGLNVLKLLTEPTAAAIALGIKSTESNRIKMIYDLGGGTFDVSIGRIVEKNGQKSELEIFAISGHTHLGGEDFDNIIIEDAIKHFQDKHEVNYPDSKTTRRRLCNQCREVKENMANTISNQQIDMVATVDDKRLSYTYTINQAQFYELCKEKFEGTLSIVDEAIENARKVVPDIVIDDILLVGGSTRIPRIKELLREKFPNAKILHNVNPDEAVAVGAAILAAQLSDPRYKNQAPKPQQSSSSSSNQPSSNNNKNDMSINYPEITSNTDIESGYMRLEIRESLPLSIGMEIRGGVNKIIIKRGTVYPCEVKIPTYTVVDNQPSFTADIFEGERARARDNVRIGTIVMNYLRPVERGSKHTTTFTIDNSGILHIKHVEEVSGRTAPLQINFNGQRNLNIDVANYVEQASRFKAADELFLLASSLRRAFEDDLHQKKRQLGSNRQGLENNIARARSIIDSCLAYCGGFPENPNEIAQNRNAFNIEFNGLQLI